MPPPPHNIALELYGLRLMHDDVVGQLHLGAHLALGVVGHHDLHLRGYWGSDIFFGGFRVWDLGFTEGLEFSVWVPTV